MIGRQEPRVGVRVVDHVILAVELDHDSLIGRLLQSDGLEKISSHVRGQGCSKFSLGLRLGRDEE